MDIDILMHYELTLTLERCFLSYNFL